MIFARVFWPLLGCAALAACSGNIGGGQSTLPGTLQNGTNPQGLATGVAATPTPSSASNVATVGANPATQALPTVAGWGGSIAFAKPSAAPSASPNPKASSAAADAGGGNSASIGVTASVVEPSDAPHFSAGSKRHSKHDAGAPTALFFISLLAPSDIAFAQYPKIAVDVPRDVIAKHRDDVFALALYDPERKDKTYRLAVAERDLSRPGPQSLPSATPVPTPMPTPFGMSNGAQAFHPAADRHGCRQRSFAAGAYRVSRNARKLDFACKPSGRLRVVRRRAGPVTVAFAAAFTEFESNRERGAGACLAVGRSFAVRESLSERTATGTCVLESGVDKRRE